MTSDDKKDLLDQIAVADIGQLRQIIERLESMECSQDAVDLIDTAKDNILSIAGSDGDW